MTEQMTGLASILATLMGVNWETTAFNMAWALLIVSGITALAVWCARTEWTEAELDKATERARRNMGRNNG